MHGQGCGSASRSAVNGEPLGVSWGSLSSFGLQSDSSGLTPSPDCVPSESLLQQAQKRHNHTGNTTPHKQKRSMSPRLRHCGRGQAVCRSKDAGYIPPVLPNMASVHVRDSVAYR